MLYQLSYAGAKSSLGLRTSVRLFAPKGHIQALIGHTRGATIAACPNFRTLVPPARNQTAVERISALAERQWGVVAHWQLLRSGAGKATVSRLTKKGWLHWVLPGVYAVGHRALSTEGWFAAALLALIHVSSTRRCRSLDAIHVHHRPGLERVWHRGLPTTPVPNILLEISSLSAPNILRKALAQAEYQRRLKLADVHAVLGKGHKGSAALRAALRRHLPQLARTKSELEDDFLFLCERYGIPIPEVNIMIAGWEVDAIWMELKVAVELDGVGNHGHQVAVARDRRKELQLRNAGLSVVRYSADQVSGHPSEVGRDLIATLDAAKNQTA